MTSTLTSSSRGFRPLATSPSAKRPSQPLPGPLAKIAEAARQNQILALQALQAAAAASTASSSSSSPPGSPPFAAATSAAATSKNGASAGTLTKRGRKFQAMRAPSSSSASGSSSGSNSPGRGRSSAKLVPLITTTVPYWAVEGSHPLIDPASGRRSEIYSLTNDRYPGAPGTALAKAREAQQKAILAVKKEAAKKLASKAELEHLGVKGLGKKRKSSSPYATVNNGLVTAAATVEKGGAAMSREPSATSRGRSTRAANNAAASSSSAAAATAAEANAAPANAAPANAAPAPAATTSRSRRPPSRSNSPVPLTSHATSGRRSGARGAASQAVASDDDAQHGRSTSHVATRSTPSRGSSPPDGTLKTPHSTLSSTAPFQSSPLAAGSLTMEPSQDADTTDAAETEAKPDKETTAGASAEPTPMSGGRGVSLKRKASALSQEILAEDEAADDASASRVKAQAGASSEDETSKRAKVDPEADKVGPATTEKTERLKRRESPPFTAFASSSRRTSPRTKDKSLAPLANGSEAAALIKYGALTESSEATKSRLSALSLEHTGAAAEAGQMASNIKRGSRPRRGGAKSDVDAEEVRDEDLGGTAAKQ